MPFWATAVLGIAGSLLGGVVTWLIFGVPPGLPAAMVGAVVLLIIYRKLVQERGITGPEARRPPTRGWWLPKAPRPRPHTSVDKLERLREAGVITEEEYAVKAAEVSQRAADAATADTDATR